MTEILFALLILIPLAFGTPMVLVAVMLMKMTWDNKERIDRLENFAGDISERMSETEGDVTKVWRDVRALNEDEDDESEAWKGN